MQPAPIPGIPAQGIDPSTGQSVGAFVVSLEHARLEKLSLTTRRRGVEVRTVTSSTSLSTRVLPTPTTISLRTHGLPLSTRPSTLSLGYVLPTNSTKYLFMTSHATDIYRGQPHLPCRPRRQRHYSSCWFSLGMLHGWQLDHGRKAAQQQHHCEHRPRPQRRLLEHLRQHCVSRAISPHYERY